MVANLFKPPHVVVDVTENYTKVYALAIFHQKAYPFMDKVLIYMKKHLHLWLNSYNFYTLMEHKLPELIHYSLSKRVFE